MLLHIISYDECNQRNCAVLPIDIKIHGSHYNARAYQIFVTSEVFNTFPINSLWQELQIMSTHFK